MADTPRTQPSIAIGPSSDYAEDLCELPFCIGDKPPAYFEGMELVPMAPTQNDRYERRALVVPEYHTIKQGLCSSRFPENIKLSHGFSVNVNPEGSPYQVNRDKRIISDAPLGRGEALLLWQEKCADIIQSRNITLPGDYEIYLNPDASEGQTSKYYLVDHIQHTVLWLDDVDPFIRDLGLYPACSVGHMRFILQEQYWRHCEYFPHRPVAIGLKKELISIFTQARADILTSSMATFPYNADECKQYLEILCSDSVLNEDNVFSNWIVARLWATVSRHRYNTFYGEDYARISRDQARYDKPTPKPSTALDVCSILSFGLPQQHSDKMKFLFIDEIAFGMHWRDFAGFMLRDWRESCVMAMGLTITGMISTLRPTNPISACLGSLSVTFALGGLASGALLLQRYTDADKFSAAAAADHLYRIEHPQLGFELAAAIYAVPRALTFWSMIFLVGHLLGTFVDFVSMIIQAPAIAFTVTFVLCVVKAEVILRQGFATAKNAGETDVHVG